MKFSKSDVDAMKALMASKKVRAFMAKPHPPTATEVLSDPVPRLGEALAASSVAKALPSVAVAPRGVLAPPKMNKTEAAYGAVLELRKRGGEIAWYAYEGITLKLAPDTRYTPDFAVMLAGGEIELHEVKGFFREDAKLKCKLAAELFPFPILVVRKVTGGWDVQRIGRKS